MRARLSGGVSSMNIYWSKSAITSLKGLSSAESKAVQRAVVWSVWSHWQVWLPFAALFVFAAVFFFLTPRFSNRFIVVVISVALLARLAAIPFNHYLDYYVHLHRQDANNSLKSDAAKPRTLG